MQGTRKAANASNNRLQDVIARGSDPFDATGAKLMFSYRHGFHAGNHADVLKHVLLVQLLSLMTRKEKSLLYVDTHAGAGAYALDAGFAAQRAEFDGGIGRLWGRAFAPYAIADYLAQIERMNASKLLTRYPGSPQLAWQMLRPQDRLRLFEAHPTEVVALREHFAEAGRRVTVTAGDGFSGLKAVLPPPSRRALVLIDPSYEDKQDYRKVLSTLKEAFQRFATGTYAVWYPKVAREESQRFPDQLRRAAEGDWFHVWLAVKAAPVGGVGLYGSGMFVFNPPWQFDTAVREAMPVLLEQLGQDAQAGYRFEARQR